MGFMKVKSNRNHVGIMLSSSLSYQEIAYLAYGTYLDTSEL